MVKHVDGFLGFLGFYLGSNRQLFMSTKKRVLYLILTLGIFWGVLSSIIYGVYVMMLNVLSVG